VLFRSLVFKSLNSPYPGSLKFSTHPDIWHLKFSSIFYSYLILYLQVDLVKLVQLPYYRASFIISYVFLVVLNKFVAQFWTRKLTILAEVSRRFPQFPREISRHYFVLGLVFSSPYNHLMVRKPEILIASYKYTTHKLNDK
jgi:hypothetical protein